MPSPQFLAEILEATAAVDAVMAEAWQLLPRKAAAEATGSSVPDTSRPSTIFFATFADPEARPDMPNSYDRRETRRSGIESGKPVVVVSPAVRATFGAPIRKSDLMIRQADGVTWIIANTFEMAGGTLKLHVNVSG